jgi:hypothetical protein
MFKLTDIRDIYRDKIDRNNFLKRLEIVHKITATRYGDSINIDGFQKISRRFSWIAILCFILNIFFVSIIPAHIGLAISIIFFFFLLFELILFKPLIFNIFEISDLDKKLIEFQKYSPHIVDNLTVGSPITNLKLYFKLKFEMLNKFKRALSIGDTLKLFCIMKVILKALVLIIWYSVVIMYFDLAFPGQILTIQEAPYEPLFIGYLYQSLSLFLSVSSIDYLIATTQGTILLFGQIIIYLSIFVVVVNRISDNISMFSNQAEDLIEQIVSAKLEISLVP